MKILPYKKIEARFVAWSAEYLDVAQALMDYIADTRFEILHFGSTSFQVGGKGIIDLSLLYKNNQLTLAVEHLLGLGFQPQVSHRPFPPERPRLDGAVIFNQQIYYIHIHVIAYNSAEHHKQLAYKNYMLNNPQARQDYEYAKKKILQSGISEQEEYGDKKSLFVKPLLHEIV